MRRTKAQAAETGRQILQAAETLFLDQGYDNVSLEEIAAAAGVTRGAVHWHFKNKQGLLLALRNDAQAPFRHLADRLSEETGPAVLQLLGEVISNEFEKLQNDPRQKGLIRVLLHLDITLSDSEDGSTFRDEMKSILVRIFQAVDRDAGLPAPWVPETAASTFIATITGLVGEWALGKGNFRLAPDGQMFVGMVLNAWTREGAQQVAASRKDGPRGRGKAARPLAKPQQDAG